MLFKLDEGLVREEDRRVRRELKLVVVRELVGVVGLELIELTTSVLDLDLHIDYSGRI